MNIKKSILTFILCGATSYCTTTLAQSTPKNYQLRLTNSGFDSLSQNYTPTSMTAKINAMPNTYTLGQCFPQQCSKDGYGNIIIRNIPYNTTEIVRIKTDGQSINEINRYDAILDSTVENNQDTNSSPYVVYQYTFTIFADSNSGHVAKWTTIDSNTSKHHASDVITCNQPDNCSPY